MTGGEFEGVRDKSKNKKCLLPRGLHFGLLRLQIAFTTCFTAIDPSVREVGQPSLFQKWLMESFIAQRVNIEESG